MATIKKACKGVSYPKSSSVSGRLGSPSKAKSGKMLKKQAAVAIAMKAAGKKPKMAKGGSFPDLNKDGKITKKDILIGKGVLPKTAKKGKEVKKAFLGLENIFGGGRDRDNMGGGRNKTKIKIKIKGKNNPMNNSSNPFGLGDITRTALYNPEEKMKRGGTMKKSAPKKSMKMGGKTKKCAYGCK